MCCNLNISCEIGDCSAAGLLKHLDKHSAVRTSQKAAPKKLMVSDRDWAEVSANEKDIELMAFYLTARLQ